MAVENPFVALTERVQKSYQHNDSTWKKSSDYYSGEELISSILWELIQANILTDRRSPTILSPSANNPTHEALIARFCDESGINAKLIAGDLVYKPKDYPSEYVTLDARMLPFASQTIDLIWDRKGALWYTCDQGDPIGVYNLLKEYERVLVPSGSVVFDANDKNLLTLLQYLEILPGIINVIIRMILKKEVSYHHLIPVCLSGQYEMATATLLQQYRSLIDTEINNCFSSLFLGEGKNRVQVLMKRH